MTLSVETLRNHLTGATPTPMVAYFEGVVGSVAIEIAAALKQSASLGGSCPPLYKKPFYLTARVTFAFVAGLLPLMMAAQSDWTAFYLGATAPLVFDRLARGLQPD